MSGTYLIDGIGDEVTVMMGILVGIFIVAVSWISTRVNEVSFTSDIPSSGNPLQTRTEGGLNENQSVSPQTPPPDTTSDNPVQSESTSENSASNSDASSGSTQDYTTLSSNETSGENLEPTVRQRFHQEVSNDTAPVQGTTPVPSSSSESATIRLKFMDETTQTIQANPDQTLESFRRQNLPSENQSRYRLIYGGQVLRDGSRTLRQLNLAGGALVPVIHCFLAPAPSPDSGSSLANSATHQMQLVADELHIGSLLLPILGFSLVCLWYLCIFHTSLFSIQSVVSIIGFTLLYFALIVNHFI